ncbi:MAG: type II toxin-antitoxin system VapC family toxin [Syntrophobacteraceae bacterium]
MTVFADTSSLFSMLVQDDYMHVRARLNYEHFRQSNTQLVTSSYVLLETMALLQRRVGLEAALDFDRNIVPLLDVIWVDEVWHDRAMQRLRTERNRRLSLTDCLSFEIMEELEIPTAFTFDGHFRERGFEIAAFHD